MTPSRWFITGAAGFIGFHLCRTLLRQEHEVVGFDNFLSGRRETIDRLQRLESTQNFTIIEGDIREQDAVRNAIDGCQVVVNLAAQVAVQRSIERPEETLAINVGGFETVHQAAREVGAGRLVYASSCAVYGDNADLPLREDAEVHPLSPYAHSKVANERFARDAAAIDPSFKAVGLRFFNVFGAWQSAEGGYAAVIPRWLNAILKGERPIVYGDGTATRDYIYVASVCNAIILAATAPLSQSAPVYNIGTGVATRLEDLLSALQDAAAETDALVSRVDPECQPWRDGDIQHSVAHIGVARAELGFEANVDLRDGLRRLLGEELPGN